MDTTEKRPEVLLIGMGGVGVLYAFILQNGGANVTAVCRSNYEAVRDRGIPTACFSNATDRLEDDLAEAGIGDAFGTIVNSSRIGAAKPEAAFYAAACEAAGVQPDEILFVDDRPENVVGALDAGIGAIRYQGVARFEAVLRRTGLLTG